MNQLPSVRPVRPPPHGDLHALPQTVPDPRVPSRSAAPLSVNYILANLVNVCRANQGAILSLVEEVRTLRREVASVRSSSVTGRAPLTSQSPNNVPRPPLLGLFLWLFRCPFPVQGLRRLDVLVAWKVPVLRPGGARLRRCPAPECDAAADSRLVLQHAPHVRCGVRHCSTHCTSRRCAGAGRPAPVKHSWSSPSVPAGPIRAPRAVATCRREARSKPVHQECPTGHWNSHCTSRRCSFHGWADIPR